MPLVPVHEYMGDGPPAYSLGETMVSEGRYLDGQIVTTVTYLGIGTHWVRSTAHFYSAGAGDFYIYAQVRQEWNEATPTLLVRSNLGGQNTTHFDGYAPVIVGPAGSTYVTMKFSYDCISGTVSVIIQGTSSYVGIVPTFSPDATTNLGATLPEISITDYSASEVSLLVEADLEYPPASFWENLVGTNEA